ncbi:MAG: integrase, partial [Thermodesulfobacteriota bacterium]
MSEWRFFHNFFLPSVKLLAKEKIASKTIRRYDPPKTPYLRVMESPLVTPATKKELSAKFKTLNPFKLKAAIEMKLKKIFQV